MLSLLFPDVLVSVCVCVCACTVPVSLCLEGADKHDLHETRTRGADSTQSSTKLQESGVFFARVFSAAVSFQQAGFVLPGETGHKLTLCLCCVVHMRTLGPFTDRHMHLQSHLQKVVWHLSLFFLPVLFPCHRYETSVQPITSAER